MGYGYGRYGDDEPGFQGRLFLPCEKEKNTISYEKIFDEIEGCFRQVEQWAAKGFDYSNAVKYQNQAEALIELIEVDVCNSVGGFDKGQKGFSADNPFERVSDKLYSRYKWLKEKYS